MPFIVEPAKIYHEKSKDFLSSGQLKIFRKSPRLFRKKQLGLIPNPTSTAMLIGSAAHKLILEGVEKYNEEYTSDAPVNPTTGKPYGPQTNKVKDWKAEVAARGMTALTGDQAELVRNLNNGVADHAEASALLAKGHAEGVIRCEYGGLPCQIRVDWFNPDAGLVDLKTCDKLEFFPHDARRYGYVYQFAFYREIIKADLGITVPVFMIAVEKSEPHSCGVWKIPEMILEPCAKENIEAIKRLIACKSADKYPTGYEVLRTFDLM